MSVFLLILGAYDAVLVWFGYVCFSYLNSLQYVFGCLFVNLWLSRCIESLGKLMAKLNFDSYSGYATMVGSLTLVQHRDGNEKIGEGKHVVSLCLGSVHQTARKCIVKNQLNLKCAIFEAVPFPRFVEGSFVRVLL